MHGVSPKAEHVIRIRVELLVSLKAMFPSGMQLQTLYRHQLVLFPTLDWTHFVQDLAYLEQKGYVEKVDSSGDFVDLRERWYRLTASGVEVADGCIHDPGLEV